MWILCNYNQNTSCYQPLRIKDIIYIVIDPNMIWTLTYGILNMDDNSLLETVGLKNMPVPSKSVCFILYNPDYSQNPTRPSSHGGKFGFYFLKSPLQMTIILHNPDCFPNPLWVSPQLRSMRNILSKFLLQRYKILYKSDFTKTT